MAAEPQAPQIPPSPQQDRYSRQILFRGIGATGQHRLSQARVAVVGVGATGSATVGLLARAGIGHLTIIDRDYVEFSNLQRQVLFDEDDARNALPKAEAARRHIARINAEIAVTPHIADLVPANIDTLLASTDLILDCTDNFETRYLLNDFAIRESIPWIYAAAVGSYAATMNILPATKPGAPFMPSHLGHEWAASEASGRTTITTPDPWQPTACLACIFPAPPTGFVETCETSGILSTTVNFAASLQVTEALKFLTGQPSLMRRTLISYDLWTGEQSSINTAKPRLDCEVCAARNFHFLSGVGRPHITLCGRNSVQIHEHHRPLDLEALKSRLAPLGSVRSNGLLLRFERDAYTLTVFPDGRALVQGTTDTGLARSLYARYIGS